MAASSKKQAKKSYRVGNWREYNESLVRRGDITFWFSEEVIDRWEHDNHEARRGRPFKYSDLAIETLLLLRELFRLPYRQTEGLGRALAKLMGIELAIPHHTSLVKRAAKLKINTQLADVHGRVDVVVDSTGLKVYGEGEWKVRQHGVDRRRDWRKIHLAVDPSSHTILAQQLTNSRTHDATAAKELLDRVNAPLDTFYGDGAYDRRPVYELLAKRNAYPIIPPRRDAKLDKAINDRNETIRQIERHGREKWKERIGYHRRSLAETAASRLKGTFGDRLKNREPPNQTTEAALRCKLLNWFVTLSMPLSFWI